LSAEVLMNWIKPSRALFRLSTVFGMVVATLIALGAVTSRLSTLTVATELVKATPGASDVMVKTPGEAAEAAVTALATAELLISPTRRSRIWARVWPADATRENVTPLTVTLNVSPRPGLAS
jgi:hypothetical protein